MEDRTKGTMGGKVAVVTGAGSGQGFETALALAGMGATVVMVGRSLGRMGGPARDVRERSGNARVEVLEADLASMASVRRLAEGFLAGHGRLDVLVNNAGVFDGQRRVTEDGFEEMFAVNHLAPFLLTNLLLPLLERGAPSRVVNVNSGAHALGRLDFDDLQSERRFGLMRTYGGSKLANLLFTYELAGRLASAGAGVAVNALDPGLTATAMGSSSKTTLPGWYRRAMRLVRPRLAKSPEEGAATAIFLATSPEVEGVTGGYFADGKEKRSSRASRDGASARRLRDVSEGMVGIPARATRDGTVSSLGAS